MKKNLLITVGEYQLDLMDYSRELVGILDQLVAMKRKLV